MIPLFKPFMPKLPLLEQVLYSGKLVGGTYTTEFENKLKQYFGTEYLFVTNSFLSAINVAVAALGLKHGDSIVMSPMACLVSTQPYASNGLKICWADIDSKRGTLDPDSLEKVITKKTKAIVHNHYCGYPGYIDEINKIGYKYNIPVIDDGIECFGSEYKGQKIGNCGTEVTVFSLSAVRIPNTIEGGIVIFKSEELYKKALIIKDSGIDRTRFRDERGEIDIRCDISEIGYCASMSNVNGYIGTEQIPHIEELLNRQRKQAEKWNSFFLKNKEYEPIVCEQCRPNYWAYGILTKNKTETIDKFRQMGFYASGIHTKNNAYSVFGSNTDLPGVNSFYNSFVGLPCGWWMND